MRTEDPDAKQQLITTAMRLFANYGRDGVSLRAIASEAGVTHGSIRYHFGTKDKLYVEAMKRIGSADDMIGQWLESDETETSGHDEGERLLRDLVHRFVLDQARLGEDKAGSAAMLQAEFGQGKGPDPAFYKAVIKPGHDHVKGIIKIIRPDIHDDKTLEILAFNLIFQCVMIRIGQPIIKKRLGSRRLSKADVAQIAESITEMTLGGLRAFKQ
ncbi:MAG: CerR family C-terminal domain-containing protein [Planctomycetota bacterium]